MQVKYPLDGSPDFDIREFVHPSIFNAVGNVRARWFISNFQRDFAFLIRKLTNSPVQINNWHTGGARVGRGTRPRSYKPKGGAELSQHYLSNAIDISVPGYTPKQLIELIFKNDLEFKAIGLTTLEHPDHTPTWLHGDCRPFIEGVHPKTGFLIVNP